MFENFKFHSRNDQITGYLWDCENPTHVMCIIHGIGEHAGRYDRMASFLNESHIAVVGMDHRGHGRSEGVRGHTAPRADVLADVDAMIDYAKEKYPNLPLVLYGHSMGGNICLDYRNRGNKNDVPDKYIVSAPWVKLVRPVPKPLYVMLKGVSKIMPKKTMCSACPKELLGNPVNLEGFEKDQLVHDRVSLQCAVEGFDVGNALADGTLENNHGADDKPILLMHGDSDRICNVEGSRMVAALNKGNPYFTYHEWPGYFHEIHNGGFTATGDKVLETIRDYILS